MASAPAKTVVFFSNSFPNPLQPYRGVYTEQLVNSAGDIIRPVIICPLPWAPRIKLIRRFPLYDLYSRIPEEYDHRKYHVYAPKYLVIPKVSLWSPVSMAISTYPLVRRLKKSMQIDMINAQNVFPEGIAAAWLGKILGLPVVITALGSDINEASNNKIRLWLTVRALQRAKGITAVSRALCEKMIEMGISPEKVHYTPNGVDNVLFQPRDKIKSRKRLGLNKRASRKILLFVGSFRPVKGIGYLLKSLNLLKQEGKLNFDTVLIGDGPLNDQMRQTIEDYNLKERVLLPGNREHNEVSTWMSAADVFCLPSLREGMPNVVLEALSCGLPVVASKVGAIPDLVGVDNGILVQAGDYVSLADALDRAINRSWNPEKIRSSILEMNWENAAARYLEVFFSNQKKR